MLYVVRFLQAATGTTSASGRTGKHRDDRRRQEGDVPFVIEVRCVCLSGGGVAGRPNIVLRPYARAPQRWAAH